MRTLFEKILISYGSVLFAASLILIGTGCSRTEEPDGSDGEYNVVVSILPQKYFVERIAAPRLLTSSRANVNVKIIVVVPPGASPSAYELSPSDMRNISQADIWFTIGVGFERAWIPRFSGSNPDLAIRSTVRDIDRLPIDRYSIPGGIAPSNAYGDNGHDHAHGWDDPHVWLSPELVRKQAVAIAECLSDLDPEMEVHYRTNVESFILEIDSLQNSIHAMLDPMRGSCFMVFHPAWGYFADEFNLVQIPVEESGNDPSPGEMSRLVDFAKDQNIQAIFVSPQFSTSSAEAIASEVNARIIYIDPLAEDWSSNLMHVAEELAGTMDTR